MFKFASQFAARTSLLHSNVYMCYNPHLMTKHLSELTIKATRRSFLNKTVLNHSKDVIQAQIRKPTDFVLKLKQEGKCPGVIMPFSKKKDEQIDVVLAGKAMKTRSESRQYPLERVYVRVAGKDHMCTLRGVKFNVKNFIEKVVFTEYVPGQANYVTVPINVTHLQQNPFFKQRFDFNIAMQQIDIICYNHEYPTKFYVDVSYVNIDRPYRIGDLANTFPPGVVLNPKVDPNKVIFSVAISEATAFLNSQNSIEQILANVNFSKEREKSKAAAAAATGTAATTGGAAGTAAKTDAKAEAPKAEAAKTDAKKKK